MSDRFGITQIAPKGAHVPQYEIDAMIGFVGVIELPNGRTQMIRTTEAFAVWPPDEGGLLGITTWADFID
jgi:hypothetical protein